MNPTTEPNPMYYWHLSEDRKFIEGEQFYDHHIILLSTPEQLEKDIDSLRVCPVTVNLKRGQRRYGPINTTDEIMIRELADQVWNPPDEN